MEVSASEFSDYLASVSDVSDADGLRYFSGEFWPSAQRASHSLHEVSYRACFKAQLPEFFISRLTGEGAVVLDPFMGRGTVPVQSALMGRVALGGDVNPLSVYLARPRLFPVSLRGVEAALGSVDWGRGCVLRDDLLVFYHPSTLCRLEALREWLRGRAPLSGGDVDPYADWVRMVALSRLSGHSPGFFSVRTLPPNQAVSVSSQRRLNAKHGLEPPERDVCGLILKKSRSLLRDGCISGGAGYAFGVGPAWDLPWVQGGSVDLVVTSPPFLDVVDYASDNWLRCWFADVDVGGVDFSVFRDERLWCEMVRRVFVELARVVRGGGWVAFEVGEVRGGRVLLERLVCDAVSGLPFDLVGVLLNVQGFTKTSNLWGVENGRKGVNTNRVVLLRRH